MNHCQQMLHVRQCVHESFRRISASLVDPPGSWTETILIHDGYYCGRCFECDGLKAIWFVEEDQVKIYDRNGSVVESIELGLDSTVKRARAA